MASDRAYIAIDLKSFYASVECVERGLDPLTTNLVVADESRTEKTICLAVSPSLKAYGISGRARLFEVVQKVKKANILRKRGAPGSRLNGSSFDETELKANSALAIDYIVATPRMAYYMEYSTNIYGIYTKYVSPEDVHVYSIDEVFIDVTNYLGAYGMSPKNMAMTIIRDVLEQTGITATAGVGTNLYLSKIAMDIVAKRMPADKDGVRIAELNEETYRRQLWTHRPLTDFWRVGSGYAKKLEKIGLTTMGDIARCSVGKSYDYYNEDLLYGMFGVNAELLIDHAWGWEECTIADIKAYKPQTSSISSGQVLPCAYTFEKARLIVREMTDALVLELVDKRLKARQMSLTVIYDTENLTDPDRRKSYTGPVETDFYGREVPKQARGGVNLSKPSSSTKLIIDAVTGLYDKIADDKLLVRRVYIAANRVISEDDANENVVEQISMFTDYEEEKRALEKERKRQLAILEIRKRFGKNAILLGMNLEQGATAIQRNSQIGGHKA